MLEALMLIAGTAVASFAAAVVLVLVLVRAIARVDGEAHLDSPDWTAAAGSRPRRRFGRRREPAWWPEFERAFADYVRIGAGQES